MTAVGRGLVPLTVSASTDVTYFAMTPPFGFQQQSYTSFPITSTTWTDFAGLDTNSIYALYADHMRVVSAGFILRATQSANNAQGYFTVQTQQQFVPSTTSIAGDFKALDNQTIANYPGMEISYVFVPTNKTLSRQFASLGTTSSNPNTIGWPAAIILVQGTTAGTVATVEYYVNVEFTLQAETIMAPLAPPPAPAKVDVIKTLDIAQSKIDPVIKGGVQVVGNLVKKHVGDALMESIEGAMEFLGFLAL
jgi:hypothetical protein